VKIILTLKKLIRKSFFKMTKQQIRENYKKKRSIVTNDQLNTISESICSIIFENFKLRNKTISLFLPIEQQNEINTYLILEKAVLNGTRVGLPRINKQHISLKHFLFENTQQLIINKLGIPEPSYGKELFSTEFDIVFVPLLAIDLKGNRIGYGKGYYDRFLKECKKECLFIGLHLFDEFTSIDDINKFDIALHYCITPTQIIQF
jgi:5-formyltetrahydrofolate cyclo-ligase